MMDDDAYTFYLLFALASFFTFAISALISLD